MGLYHSFWNDAKANNEALVCISEIFLRIKFVQNIRIVVCGDFNGLRAEYTSSLL